MTTTTPKASLSDLLDPGLPSLLRVGFVAESFDVNVEVALSIALEGRAGDLNERTRFGQILPVGQTVRTRYYLRVRLQIRKRARRGR